MRIIGRTDGGQVPVTLEPPKEDPKEDLPGVFKNGQLSVLSEFMRPNGEVGYLAANGVCYRKTAGSIVATVPMSRELLAREFRTKPDGDGWLHNYDLSSCPPPPVLWELHERLFGGVDREVMCLLGRTRLGHWVAAVPDQIGTGSYCKIADEDEGGAAEALRGAGARCTGIAHCHPGAWVGFSGIDRELFEKVPGIHPILSRDGTKYQVHIASSGFIWSQNIKEIAEQDRTGEGLPTLMIVTSRGRPLEELLREPQKVTYYHPNPGYGSSYVIGEDGYLFKNKEEDGSKTNWEKRFDEKFRRAGTSSTFDSSLKTTSPEEIARRLRSWEKQQNRKKKRTWKNQKGGRSFQRPGWVADQEEAVVLWSETFQSYQIGSIWELDPDQLEAISSPLSEKISELLRGANEIRKVTGKDPSEDDLDGLLL